MRVLTALEWISGSLCIGGFAFQMANKSWGAPVCLGGVVLYFGVQIYKKVKAR
jgi:hypothetical protein